MTNKTQLYFHKPTGNITTATKKQAAKLGEEWERIEFVKNQEGEQVMRFRFNGVTVDVQENGTQEVAIDGNSQPE